MKTEVYIYNLNGNRAAVRDYANTIASMSATSSNAYVMAFDKNNETLWTVQADNLDSVNEVINWQGVRRVEIYDHSADGAFKVEYVYITSRKSLNEYTSERNASEFVVVGNTTQYTAYNWQKTEADESDNSDDNSEDKQTAAEPSALAQKVAKVAESVKTYAAVVRALAQSLTLAATYGAQRTAAALRAAHRATIAARIWLRASHEFYAQDGDPIRCTGWQFVGYNIAAAVVALLLCIEY